MRTLARWLGGFAVLALSGNLLAACAPAMSVSSYAEPGADIRRYRTFEWGPAQTFSTGDPRLDNNRFFDERVRGQVEKELAARGFAKANSPVPDLIVHYHASITQEIDIRTVDPGSSYCDDVNCQPFVYEAGTLFVDLVDPKTNKVVWRGWAEGSVDGAIDNQQWMEARVDEAVAKILERLPSRL